MWWYSHQMHGERAVGESCFAWRRAEVRERERCEREARRAASSEQRGAGRHLGPGVDGGGEVVALVGVLEAEEVLGAHKDAVGAEHVEHQLVRVVVLHLRRRREGEVEGVVGGEGGRVGWVRVGQKGEETGGGGGEVGLRRAMGG